jgi:hypothetical protein
MNYKLTIMMAFLFLSCSKQEEAETTGSIMEFVHVDPSYEMEDQPEIIKSFFLLDPIFIGEDFCYDHQEIQSVLLADQIETSGMSSWDLYSLNNSNNYLGLENTECLVTLEFKTFVSKRKQYAFLNQINRSRQRFDYLELDTSSNQWFRTGFLPGPAFVDYFEDLSAEDSIIVNENGVQFVYLSETSDTLWYYFSDSEMAQNVGYELAENLKADYRFELLIHHGEFSLVRRLNHINRPERYLVAYADRTCEPNTLSDEFHRIIDALSEYDIHSNLLCLGAQDYKTNFGRDTFDFGYLKNMEPRDGFWFLEYGKEPLDLMYDEVNQIIGSAKVYFDNP